MSTSDAAQAAGIPSTESFRQDQPVCVMVACGSPEQAEALGRALVDQQLAACVQSVPITSWFRWDGEIQAAEEHLLLIKTVGERVSDVEALVGREHPYDVPELLTLPVIHGSTDYLEWMRSAVGMDP